MKWHLDERIFERQISTRRELKRLLLGALTACFLYINVLVFEISRETDKQKKKKIGRPCFKPVSQQNKFTSAPFSASITCANKAAVADYRNYMADKT